MTTEENLFTNPHADQNIYSDFAKSIGRESEMASQYLLTLRDTLRNGVGIQHLGMDDLWRLKDEIFAQESRGEITLDEMMAKTRAVNILREKTVAFEEAEVTVSEFSNRAVIEGVANSSIDIASVDKLIARTSSVNNVSSNQAPFGDYENNTDQVWKYVAEKKIRDYLLSRVFLDTRTLYDIELNNTDSTTYIRNPRYHDIEHYFSVPTNLIVNAAGFDSWLGRSNEIGDKGMGEKSIGLPDFYSEKGRSVSLHAIKAYASYPTELPPVTHIELYVQPNGLAYAGNGSGDSHRIGAAILRGQQITKAANLSVTLLKENYF